MRVGIVVPHIFMQQEILPQVIFSPGQLAIDLAEGLQDQGADVSLFTPGHIQTKVKNINADLSYFKAELDARNDSYIDLLKKHPLTFISLARQVQAELIAKAYQIANDNQLDVVHIYTNEEDTALPFAKFCNKPVVFTHHDPFNFLVKYRAVFPKYNGLNWLSMSLAQRRTMPEDTNWVGNIYHGLKPDLYQPNYQPQGQYLAFLGRIVEPKGVELAIQAVQRHNQQHPNNKYQLKIAGKHYADSSDSYWQLKIKPAIDRGEVEYAGYLKTIAQKQEFLGNASGLLVPSTFEEPFGMVMIEALACGTPIIGLNSGAIPEIIKNGQTGWLVHKQAAVNNLAEAINRLDKISRQACRKDFETRFSLERMCRQHLEVYQNLQNN